MEEKKHIYKENGKTVIDFRNKPYGYESIWEYNEETEEWEPFVEVEWDAE